MIYRRFGRTELQMPVISCGGMRYQQAWDDLTQEEITDESQKNVDACIQRSLDLGITHIETARGYGSSERQLGNILPKLPRDKIIVQTKVVPADSREAFLEDFDKSMDRLQLDYVDLLAVHGLNTDEVVDKTINGGALDALKQIKKEGRARFIGFSTHAGPEPIIKAVETGEFDYMNLHCFYVDQRNGSAIEAAAKQDMGVFIISPNDKGGKLYEPSQKLVDLCKPLSPIGFNTLFCLSNPNVHTLSCGIAKPDEFDPMVEVVDQIETATQAIAPILARLDAEKESKLGKFWMENWQKNLPASLPGDVAPYHILRLYDLYLAFDMLAYGQMRYNLLGDGGHWFPGNKADQLEWDKLPEALAESPVADEIIDKLRAAHEVFNSEDKKRLSES